MALIKCPECGREISDKAVSCPGCGCPASEWSSYSQNGMHTVDTNVRYDDKNSIHGKHGIILKKNERKITIMEHGEIKCNCSQALLQIIKIAHTHEETTYIILAPETNSVIVLVPDDKEQDNLFQELFFEEIQKYLASQKKYDKTSVSDFQNKEFDGIYRYTNFGKKEVYCPRCGSEDCSYYQEQKIVPGKTKTSYSANLNPLKPFTFINKKEKIIKKEQIITENKFLCNKCGKIFS